MQQILIKFTFSFLLIFTFTLSARHVEKYSDSDPSISNCSLDLDEILNESDFEEIFNMQGLNNNRPCNGGGCADVIQNLQNQFSEFVLFETFVIPLLNSKRATFEQMNRLGQKYITRLINAIHRYNPSLNTKKLRQSLSQLVNKTSRATITNTLNRPEVRQQLQNNFSRLTSFWRKFLSGNFQARRANANFRQIIALTSQLNLRNRRRDTGQYQLLVKAVLKLMNEIKTN